MTETLKAIDAMDMLSDTTLPNPNFPEMPSLPPTTVNTLYPKKQDVNEEGIEVTNEAGTTDELVADLSDVKDEDIMEYIVENEAEVQVRDEIWQELNQEWIIKQEQKQKEMEVYIGFLTAIVEVP
jgi:hypothetical protein